MANKVFANDREISCKAGNGKSICAFPDTCFTLPENPATPTGVPVPYPNTGIDEDTTEGSKSVKITGKEVMLKDKSYFKTSYGDEAGCAAKKGVITSVNRGKVYFISWSMDVKVEGENVVRHLDLTTHNHASLPSNAPPQVHTALITANRISECQEAVSKVLTECEPWDEKAKCPEEHEKRIDLELVLCERTKQQLLNSGLSASAVTKHKDYEKTRKRVNDQYMGYTVEIGKTSPCRLALRCILMPYNEMKKVKCIHQTPEHMIEKSSVAGVGNYNPDNAPCAFTEGTSWHLGEHGVLSAARENLYQDWAQQNPGATYDTAQAAKIGAQAHQAVNRVAKCNQTCTEKQLLQGHQNMNVNPTDPLTPTQTGISDPVERARRKKVIEIQQEQLEAILKRDWR